MCADTHPGAYTGQDAYTGRLIAHSLRGEGFDASEDGTGRGTPLVPVLPFDTTQMTSVANRSAPKFGDPCHPLAAGAHAPAIAQSFSNRGIACDVPETLRAASHGALPMVGNAMQVRRLTPRECERLQGFPDDYTLIPLHNKKPSDVLRFSADGPRYKALGNSWAIPNVRWIGERIDAVSTINALRKAA